MVNYGKWGCDEVNCNGACEHCAKNEELNRLEQEEDFDLEYIEELGKSSNMYTCDLSGMCGGISCENYFNCH